MKKNDTSQKNIFYIALATGGLLLIPLVLTLLGSGVDGDGVHWTLSDFVIMGALLFATGLLLNFATTRVRSSKHRLVLSAAILVLFFLIWAELAVGVFGTPFAGS